MSEETAYCNFCGKTQHEVQMMIAGPTNDYICDECVLICVLMLESRGIGDVYLSEYLKVTDGNYNIKALANESTRA